MKTDIDVVRNVEATGDGCYNCSTEGSIETGDWRRLMECVVCGVVLIEA